MYPGLLLGGFSDAVRHRRIFRTHTKIAPSQMFHWVLDTSLKQCCLTNSYIDSFCFWFRKEYLHELHSVNFSVALSADLLLC